MNWKSSKSLYAFYGICFGFLFPIFSSILDAYLKFSTISFQAILSVQASNPLLWVIDSAPLFLGSLAYMLGVKQDFVKKVNRRLQKTNKRLKLEISKSHAIESSLRDMIAVYKEDLHSAKIVQEFSLPEIPKLKEYNIFYKYLPLNPVGGDMISLVHLEEGGLAILVGDVVGHGISAALITSLIKVLSNKNCRHYGTEPKKYLEYLNTEAVYYLPEDYYFTAIYGLLESKEEGVRFTFSRGGHPYPFSYSSQRQEVLIFEVSGSPLGLIPNLQYSEMSQSLSKGDKLFFITDGLLEVRNIAGKLLGSLGFRDIVQQICRKNLSIEKTVEEIIEKVTEYSEGIPLEDDRLILGIEIV